MENRGRSKDVIKTMKTHELYESGMTTKEIAQQMGCTQAMVQYRLRQHLNVNEILNTRRKSLALCFWEAPEEVRIEVAKLLNYQYIPTLETKKENVADIYKQLQAQIPVQAPSNEKLIKIAQEIPTTEEKTLLNKVIDLFDGKIAPNEIEENFTQDEIKKLNSCPRYVAFYGQLAWGVKTNITREQVLEEMANKGIR